MGRGALHRATAAGTVPAVQAVEKSAPAGAGRCPRPRALEALTEAGRRALAQQRQADLCHITWHVPGLVWSLDDAELARVDSHLLRLQQVQDLASRYKFPPWVGERILLTNA